MRENGSTSRPAGAPICSSASKKQLFDLPTLFTQVFILVDDYLKQHPRQDVGRKSLFSDSEVITLLLMMDFLPYPSERQYFAYNCRAVTLGPGLRCSSKATRCLGSATH